MRLSFVVLLFTTLGSCNIFMGKNKNAKLENKVWELVDTDKKLNSFTKPQSIKLNKETNRFYAFSGCNTVNGTYEFIDKNGIKFTVLQQTYKACQNIELERAFIDMLKSVDGYKFTNSKLLFLKNGKEVASFE